MTGFPSFTDQCSFKFFIAGTNALESDAIPKNLHPVASPFPTPISMLSFRLTSHHSLVVVLKNDEIAGIYLYLTRIYIYIYI